MNWLWRMGCVFSIFAASGIASIFDPFELSQTCNSRSCFIKSGEKSILAVAKYRQADINAIIFGARNSRKMVEICSGAQSCSDTFPIEISDKEIFSDWQIATTNEIVCSPQTFSSNVVCRINDQDIELTQREYFYFCSLKRSEKIKVNMALLSKPIDYRKKFYFHDLFSDDNREEGPQPGANEYDPYFLQIDCSWPNYVCSLFYRDKIIINFRGRLREKITTTIATAKKRSVYLYIDRERFPYAKHAFNARAYDLSHRYISNESDLPMYFRCGEKNLIFNIIKVSTKNISFSRSAYLSSERLYRISYDDALMTFWLPEAQGDAFEKSWNPSVNRTHHQYHFINIDALHDQERYADIIDKNTFSSAEGVDLPVF